MLKLRRAIVIDAGPPGSGPEQELVIELEGGTLSPGKGVADAPAAEVLHRPAIADIALVGRAEVGDELVVNVQARDLGLGSGGFDIVHVNLSRGLESEGTPGANVMKLNYTSLQHTVDPVEDGVWSAPWIVRSPCSLCTVSSRRSPGPSRRQFSGARLGYVQTAGGALPGGHSRAVRSLRERGLLAGHLTAGAAFGGEGEAITTIGALHHGLRDLGWDAAICGPGPGIVGSSSPLGHGGMFALDSAHAALALGCPDVVGRTDVLG